MLLVCICNLLLFKRNFQVRTIRTHSSYPWILRRHHEGNQQGWIAFKKEFPLLTPNENLMQSSNWLQNTHRSYYRSYSTLSTHEPLQSWLTSQIQGKNNKGVGCLWLPKYGSKDSQNTVGPQPHEKSIPCKAWRGLVVHPSHTKSNVATYPYVMRDLFLSLVATSNATLSWRVSVSMAKFALQTQSKHGDHGEQQLCD